MLAKLIGIALIIIGGIITIKVLFPFLGSLLESIFHLIGLVIALGFIAIGWRLVSRED